MRPSGRLGATIRTRDRLGAWTFWRQLYWTKERKTLHLFVLYDNIRD